jgi:hypothetical protein
MVEPTVAAALYGTVALNLDKPDPVSLCTIIADEKSFQTAYLSVDDGFVLVQGVDAVNAPNGTTLSEEQIAHCSKKTLKHINQKFNKNFWGSDDLKKVLVVGDLFDNFAQVIGCTQSEILQIEEENVAKGVAINAAILSGDMSVKDIILIDAIYSAIGVEIDDGTVETVLPCGTSIPTCQKLDFTVANANQQEAMFNIVVSSDDFESDRKSVGVLTLSSLGNMQPDETKIELRVDIDANKIIFVTAKDSASGKEVFQKFKSVGNFMFPID